jgi:hypothetical protein
VVNTQENSWFSPILNGKTMDNWWNCMFC